MMLSSSQGRQQILQAASSMFLSSNTNPRLRDAATAENILNLVKAMSDVRISKISLKIEWIHVRSPNFDETMGKVEKVGQKCWSR